jgi:hypothetical protein
MVSVQHQQLNSYRIYNANPYFGEAPDCIREIDGLTASWIEVAG